MTGKRFHLNNKFDFHQMRRHHVSVSVFLFVVVVAFTGCGRREISPGREELAELLGALEPDVVVLGGELHEPTSSVDSSSSVSPTSPGKITKLWVVRSRNALPAPQPVAEIQAGRSNVSPSVKFSAEIFAARTLYDIASGLGIKENELSLAESGKLEKAKGRLTEWSKSPWSIRIRDFQAEVGWLSVVEAFVE